MSAQGEELAGKCAQLLRASCVPPSGNLRNVHIDWGQAQSESASAGDGEQPRLQGATPALPAAATSLFDEEHNNPLVPNNSADATGFRADPPQLAVDVDVLQAPSIVPDFYPGNRLIVSAILNCTKCVPDHVVLRGEAPDGTPVELRVPVHAVNFPVSRTPLVHTLAAHRLIQELEDGYVQCLGLKSGATTEASKLVARGAAVFLSVHYHLASKYASFIAVEEKQDTSAALGDGSDFEVLDEEDVNVDEWEDDFEVDKMKPETRETGPNASSLFMAVTEARGAYATF